MATIVGSPWAEFESYVYDPKVEFVYPNFVEGMTVAPPEPVEVCWPFNKHFLM